VLQAPSEAVAASNPATRTTRPRILIDGDVRILIDGDVKRIIRPLLAPTSLKLSSTAETCVQDLSCDKT
jgi:hypothetical protein